MHKIPIRKNIFEYLYTKLSKPISKILVKTRMTPNQITIISGIFGLFGAFFLTQSGYINLIYSAIFIQLYTILDLVDGDIARIKKLQSQFGKWLDVYFDKLNDFFIILGLSVGVYSRSGEVVYLYLGIILMGTIFFIQFFMIMNKNIYNDINNNLIVDTSNSGKSIHFQHIADKYKLFNNIRYFISTHLMLEHCTFLFIVSVFCVLNMTQLALWFLVIFSIVNIIYTTMNVGLRLSLLDNKQKP